MGKRTGYKIHANFRRSVEVKDGVKVRYGAKVRATTVLTLFVLVGAALIFGLNKLEKVGFLNNVNESLKFLSLLTETEETSSTVSKKHDTSSSFEKRQIILSMGERPDVLFISWRDKAGSRGYLRYGTDKNELYKEEVLIAQTTTVLQGKFCRHTIKLEDIKAGEKYYYEVGDGTAFDDIRSFEAPQDNGKSTFLYLGDVQFELSLSDYDRWRRMVGRAYRANSELDFAIIGGDMVSVPTDEKQWTGFLSNCDIFSRLPLMTVPGNHEGVHSNITYKKLFAMPRNGPQGLKEEFYFFDYGNCRFIMMDSSFFTEARQQSLGKNAWRRCEKSIEIWLKKTLRKNKKTWTIAVIHHPPYGMHDHHTVSPQIREDWLPIMEATEVDVILSGHQHVYMRSGRINGIVYIIGNSGVKMSEFYNGCNAPLYSRSLYSEGPNYQIITTTNSRLQLISYDEKGLVIDETSLKKGLGTHIIKFFSGS